MTALDVPRPAPAGVAGAPMLRSLPFDRFLLVVLPVTAVAAAALAVTVPSLATGVLLADLWLLGYHHVGATFTRFIGDPALRREHRAMLTWIPPLVIVATVIAGVVVGTWLIATVYFFWQFFHYTRQSWGVSEAFRRKAGGGAPSTDLKLAFWAVPLAGVLWRCSQGADRFLGMPIRLPEIPVPVAVGGLVVATLLVGRFLVSAAGRAGGAGPAFVSHLVIFTVAYVAIPEITAGWLALNIWHNGQYLAFVWHTNNRSFGASAEPANGGGRFTEGMRRLSRTENLPGYLVVCVLATGAIYAVSSWVLGAVGISVALVYMSVNFHHYLVDGMIWKLRKPTLSRELGLGETPLTSAPR